MPIMSTLSWKCVTIKRSTATSRKQGVQWVKMRVWFTQHNRKISDYRGEITVKFMYLQQFIYTNPLFLYKIMIFASTGCKNLECQPSLCAFNNNYLISLHPGLPKLPAATKNQLFCTAWYSAYLKPDSLEKGGKISHLLQQ